VKVLQRAHASGVSPRARCIMAVLHGALLASCGGEGNEQGTRAVVTKAAPIAIDVPVLSGASDPFGGNAAGTAVLDFDGDGLRDLLITPSYLSMEPELPVTLLRHTSAGFVDGRSAFGATVPTMGAARTPQVQDFDMDGREDYFAADHGLEILDDGQFIHIVRGPAQQRVHALLEVLSDVVGSLARVHRAGVTQCGDRVQEPDVSRT